MNALSPEADALRSLAFFGELADDDLLRVTRIGRRRAFDAGEHPALDRGQRSANVTAVEPVEALVIETIYFESFLMENPSVAAAILRSVVGRLHDLQARPEGGESAGATTRSDRRMS